MKKIRDFYQKVFGGVDVYLKVLILVWVCLWFINWTWYPGNWNVLCRVILVLATLIGGKFIEVLAYLVQKEDERREKAAEKLKNETLYP